MHADNVPTRRLIEARRLFAILPIIPAAFKQGRRLFEGGVYSRKYGNSLSWSCRTFRTRSAREQHLTANACTEKMGGTEGRGVCARLASAAIRNLGIRSIKYVYTLGSSVSALLVRAQGSISLVMQNIRPERVSSSCLFCHKCIT